MLENANYLVIFESCASISGETIRKDRHYSGCTEIDFLRLIGAESHCEIIEEPSVVPTETETNICQYWKTLDKHLKELMEMPAETKQKRYEKFKYRVSRKNCSNTYHKPIIRSVVISYRCLEFVIWLLVLICICDLMLVIIYFRGINGNNNAGCKQCFPTEPAIMDLTVKT
jgi:hypothetical protein